MPYFRTHVKQALLEARRDGKPTEGLRPDDRETVIQLERWSYLPIDQEAVDKRIQDWYVSQGLVMRPDTPRDTPEDTPQDIPEDTPKPVRAVVANSEALEAAEAALLAATAALRLAKAMAS